MANIKSISGKASTWTAIIQPTAKDLQFLDKKFKFAQEDIAEALPSRHAQHPHLSLRSNYLFIVALFPIYLKDKRKLQTTEVDMFIDRYHLFTVHSKHVPVIHDLYKKLEDDRTMRNEFMNEPPLVLLYEILGKLFHSLMPMLEHIHRDIKEIERNLFAEKEQEMVEEIMIIKSNILNFKRTMKSHQWMIKKILEHDLSVIGEDQNTTFMFNRLLDQLSGIAAIIDTYAESIESLEATNNTKLTIKTNEDIRRLTVFTVFIFIIGVFTGIFGMETKSTPIVGSRYDFWIILAIIIATLGGFYTYFKSKKIL